MRRLYVAPHDVWKEHINYFHTQVGSHYIYLLTLAKPENAALVHDPVKWEALPEVQAWRAAGAYVLLSTSLGHSEACEDIWHNHPDVAILPHPTFEGNDPLSKHKDSKVKKLKQQHLDALATIGVTDKHTVWDVHEIASNIHPLCKLRVIV